MNVNPFDTGFDENIHVMRFAAVAKDVSTWRHVQPKLDLQDVQPTAKRLRYGYEDEEDMDSKETDSNENDYLVDDLISQLEDIWEKWMEAESRVTGIEFQIREQVSRETTAELNKMEELYLGALKRESDTMNDHLQKENQSMYMQL